jgi:cytochrome c
MKSMPIYSKIWYSKVYPIIITLVLTGASTAYAEDINTDSQIKLGEQLVKESCTKCHGDSVYTRKNRLMNSMAMLRSQVTRCRDNTNTLWTDEDTEAVVQYLNKKYYHF